MPELFLFTVRFPYNVHEVFLEAEIAELAKCFDKITIQPMQGSGPLRTVPRNVSVAPPIWSGRAGKLKFYGRGLLNPKVWRHALRKLKDGAGPKSKAGLIRLLMWSIYRVSLESSPLVRRILLDKSHGKNVVAYSYWGHTPALATPLLAENGVPTAVRFHRVDLYKEAVALSDGSTHRLQYFPWHQEIADKAALLVFISNHGYEYFADNWPSTNLINRCTISYLGTPNTSAAPPIASPKRAEYLVASCSRLEPIKQVDRIYALLDALSNDRSVHWVHFGGSTSDLGRAKAEFVPKRGRLTVEIRGHTPNSEIRKFYATNAVDFFVNLSASEGVPVSIMEAISFNIPVLATDVGGVKDVVVPGKSGALCTIEDTTNPNALAVRVQTGLQEGGELATCQPRTLWKQRFRAQENYYKLAERLLSL